VAESVLGWPIIERTPRSWPPSSALKRGKQLTRISSKTNYIIIFVIFTLMFGRGQELFRQFKLKTFCSTPIKSWEVGMLDSDLVQLISPKNWVKQNINWTKSKNKLSLINVNFN
jgi:hypothetical protein